MVYNFDLSKLELYVLFNTTYGQSTTIFPRAANRGGLRPSVTGGDALLRCRPSAYGQFLAAIPRLRGPGAAGLRRLHGPGKLGDGSGRRRAIQIRPALDRRPLQPD